MMGFNDQSWYSIVLIVYSIMTTISTCSLVVYIIYLKSKKYECENCKITDEEAVELNASPEPELANDGATPRKIFRKLTKTYSAPICSGKFSQQHEEPEEYKMVMSELRNSLKNKRTNNKLELFNSQDQAACSDVLDHYDKVNYDAIISEKFRNKKDEANVSEMHEYETVLTTLKTLKPQLYETVISELENNREKRAIKNSKQSDLCVQVEHSDALDHTYDKVNYDAMMIPEKFRNQKGEANVSEMHEYETVLTTLKTLKPEFYNTAMSKLENNRKERTIIKNSKQFDLCVQVEHSDALDHTYDKVNYDAMIPEKIRNEEDEANKASEMHEYKEIITRLKTLYPQFYQTVMTDIQTRTTEKSRKQGAYSDSLDNTYEEVNYQAIYHTFVNIARTSMCNNDKPYGTDDHLKYFKPSCSQNSLTEPYYLEAKQFLPTEDCPEKLRSLCSLTGAKPEVSPRRKRLQSESAIGSKKLFRC